MKKIFFPAIVLWRLFWWWVNGRMTLTFESPQVNQWYVKYPEYPGPKHNLAMVAGADKMCQDLYDRAEIYKDSNEYEVDVVISRNEQYFPIDVYDTLTLLDTPSSTGRYYQRDTYKGGIRAYTDVIWLCPVTVYTFGYYPKKLYIEVL